MSLDFIHRAVASDHSSSDSAATMISEYMDLRLQHHHHHHHHSGPNEVVKAECECCGLAEDCTRAYERQVRDRFCGRWLCGLCSEAVKVELDRLGLARHIVREEALVAHMEVCKKFNKTVRLNPAMSVAGGMAEILKKSSSKERGCKVFRTCSAIPSLGE